MITKARTDRGSALIVVFWLIAILGMVIFGAARFVSLDSLWISGLRKSALAARHAETGLAIASHPRVSAGDPVLRRDMGEGGGFVADLTTEEGLIPINPVLSGPQKPVVKRLLRGWGMDEREAAALTDALADWIDADDLAGLNGAEADAYTAMGRRGMPFNRPFSTLDEMRNVRGMDRLELLKPDWSNSFTVHSSGKFDLNAAKPDVLSAVLGVPFEVARSQVLRRDGVDGIRGTVDDRPFVSVREALQAFGVAEAGTADFFTAEGTTRRIQCEGYFADMRQRIVEVQDVSGNRIWRGQITTRISNGKD